MALSAEERTRLEQELADVRAAKKKALDAASYSGGGTSVQRQNLQALIDEESRLERKLAKKKQVKSVYPV